MATFVLTYDLEATPLTALYNSQQAGCQIHSLVLSLIISVQNFCTRLRSARRKKKKRKLQTWLLDGLSISALSVINRPSEMKHIALKAVDWPTWIRTLPHLRPNTLWIHNTSRSIVVNHRRSQLTKWHWLLRHKALPVDVKRLAKTHHDLVMNLHPTIRLRGHLRVHLSTVRRRCWHHRLRHHPTRSSMNCMTIPDTLTQSEIGKDDKCLRDDFFHKSTSFLVLQKAAPGHHHSMIPI